MDQDPFHAERVRHCAGVLAAGATEASERVARDVMTSRDRNLADRGRHVVDGDVEEPACDLVETVRTAELIGNLLKPCLRRVAVEGLISVRPEHAGKTRRV